MKLDKPRFCACGNPATLIKQHEPICQRCHDLEHNQLVAIKANRKVGVEEPKPRRGNEMNWEQRYVMYADSQPIAGDSLQILEQLLKAA